MLHRPVELAAVIGTQESRSSQSLVFQQSGPCLSLFDRDHRLSQLLHHAQANTLQPQFTIEGCAHQRRRALAVLHINIRYVLDKQRRALRLSRLKALVIGSDGN
jgi:hypothetical protein